MPKSPSEVLESRDYVDHLASMRAAGSLDDTLTRLLAGETRDR